MIAPGRLGRPGARGRTERVAPAAVCPLCEGHEGLTPPEVAAVAPPGRPPDGPGWSVRTVPNKYPAVPGHEVVVHGPAHVLSVADVPDPVMVGSVGMWLERARVHSGAGAASVLVAVNEGAAAGASLEHSHSQIVPFARITPGAAARRAAFSAGCPLCPPPAGHVVRHADGLLTVCPPWSRVPYELLIVPEQHRPWPDDSAAVAAALADAARRLRAALGTDLSWNAILHLPPAGDRAEHHWHLELLPRLTVPASLELGAGVWVNIVDPTAAAAELAT